MRLKVMKEEKKYYMRRKIMKLDNVIAKRKSKTIYRDGDSAIKVFDEGYFTADVLNEALNNARVENCGLNIPKIREVTKTEGKWAIVTDFIEGQTLAELIDKNPDKLNYYMKKFVELQIEVHSKTVPLLNKLKDKMNRKIDETGLDETTRYDLHTRLEGMPKHTRLCHGDFNPSNIIVDEKGNYFIIDWAHVTIGNASADVARTYLLFCLSGDRQKAEFYLDMYCKMSDTEKRYIQKWIPIVAASHLVKDHPQEREFLLNWINVVDYE